MELKDRKTWLEELYRRYNDRKFVHPDPLEFLFNYDDLLDREIVGVIAASLAYGRVAQILKSVSCVLAEMPSPRAFLEDSNRNGLYSTFAGFKHRFTTGEDLALMLYGVKRVIERYGSLYNCLLSGTRRDDDTILPALSHLLREISAAGRCGFLLASPEGGSACKRWNLFLRWMIREDAVDPGGWKGIPLSKLIVPLDTHMHRECIALGLTKRGAADLKTACEITLAFKEICPEDPVRYDFALTRQGIWGSNRLQGAPITCKG